MNFFAEIKNSILWDFQLENEFKNRRRGYAFVIDVCDEIPLLAIYVIKDNVSKTQVMQEQPPRELMIKAVEEQGGNIKQDHLFNINGEIRRWREDNIFN